MEVKVVDYRSNTVQKDFSAALKEIGFAVIFNHPVDNELIDRVYEDWYAFFCSDEKYQYEFNNKTHDGYIPLSLSETAKGNDIKDIKEFYHLFPHGRCPENLKSQTMKLYQNMFDMAKTLLGWVQENTPEEITHKLSMPLSEMLKDSEHTLIRLIHYPPLTGNEPADAVRAAAHEDINLLTLLPAATAEGLQVKDAEGNWLTVPINPGWIIVNAGDMLQECTDFYYPSTTHRVINPVGESAKQSRLSMPLFLHPRDTVRLSDRHTAGSYRAERFAELGLD